MTTMTLEEVLVRAELDRRGLPIPPPATMRILVEKATAQWAEHLWSEMTADGPDEADVMFSDWAYVIHGLS